MYRRGQLNFLMELLIIVLVIVLLSTFVFRQLTDEAKYHELDSHNLALFLERIPSIDENFKYNFQFSNNVSVEFVRDAIAVDNPFTVKKIFIQEYQNPKDYTWEMIFDNVSELYFYKIGNKVHIVEEPNSDLDLQLTQIREVDLPELQLNFISDKEQDSSNLQFVLSDSEINLTTERSLQGVINDPSGKVLWINMPGEGFDIKYNDLGRPHAIWIYNKLVGEEGVSFEPLSDYSEILSLTSSTQSQLETIPIVITSSSDFGGYIVNLK